MCVVEIICTNYTYTVCNTIQKYGFCSYWAGHVARMVEERGVYRFLVGKPEGKRPLGSHRLRWVDNIRMDLQEV